MTHERLHVAQGAKLAGLGVAVAFALMTGVAPQVAVADEVVAVGVETAASATASTEGQEQDRPMSEAIAEMPGDVVSDAADCPTEADVTSATVASGASDSVLVDQVRDDAPDNAIADVAESKPADATSPADAKSEDAGKPEEAPRATAETSAAGDAQVANADVDATTAAESPSTVEEAVPTAEAEASTGIVDKTNVYRLFNPRNGEHLYTTSLLEATTIASQQGWQWEGVGFTASSSKGQAVWRLYERASGLHLWTTDANERKVLLGKGKAWDDEGTAWYSAGAYRMTRLYNPAAGQHLYTRDANEASVLTNEQGWTLEAGAGTWNTGSASDYVPIVARWLVSDSWGSTERYWIQGDGSIAKNRMVYAGEGAGYNAYATANGAVVRNRHVNFADGVYSADNDGRLTKATWLQGIDIFSGEGDMDVANVDADFVIVKATQGTQYTNPYYIGQANGALSANKLLGFYHYASTNWGGGDPIAEADYFVSRVQTYVGRAILILDWEGGDDGTNNNFGRNDSWYVKTFLDRVYQRTGIKGLVYTSKGAVATTDYSATARAGYGLWVAQYLYYSYNPNRQAQGYVTDPMTTHSSTTWSNGMTGSWPTPVMYQYTSEGHIAGYHNGVDLSKFYGSSDTWKSWASKR